VDYYSYDGSIWGDERARSRHDLVEHLGPLPDSSQRAPVSRPAETESTTAVAGGVSDDPGRTIYDLEEKLKTANATIIGQTAEIDRLRAEWQAEFTAAQQLRSEVAQLERLLDDAREELRELREDREATGHHCEGAKSAYLAVIKTLLGVRS
jgi:outer membrane murein-binding lipoprotein Lpp